MNTPVQDSLLIRGAEAILTGLRGPASRHAGPDIRIQAGRIAAIGQLTPLPGERTLEARGCVVYPAWVNTHHHLFQSLLKGDPAGIDATLSPWLMATPWRLRPHMDETMFRLAARIGLVELALSGCATVADHNYHYWPGMPFDGSAVLFDEADALGLRFVLCRGGGTLSRVPATELPPPAAARVPGWLSRRPGTPGRTLARRRAGRHAPGGGGADHAAPLHAAA